MAGVRHPQNTMKVCLLFILQPHFSPDSLMLLREFDAVARILTWLNTKASVHLAEYSFFKFYNKRKKMYLIFSVVRVHLAEQSNPLATLGQLAGGKAWLLKIKLFHWFGV